MKSAYGAVLEHDAFDLTENGSTDLLFQQATAFNNISVNHAFSSPTGHLTPTRRSSNINRRPSNTMSQCPFSGHKIDIES